MYRNVFTRHFFYCESRDRKRGVYVPPRCLPGVERGAVMSLQFTDEEFQGAWRELDEPQLEGGWELFTETMGVKIYRLYDKVQTITTTADLQPERGLLTD